MNNIVRAMLVRKAEEKLDLTLWLLKQTSIMATILLVLSIFTVLYVFERYATFDIFSRKAATLGRWELMLFISLLTSAIAGVGCITLAAIQYLSMKKYLRIICLRFAK